MEPLETLHREHFHPIETDRLVLRPFTMEDASAMFSYTSRPENFYHIRRSHHTDIRETEAFLEGAIARYQAHQDFLWGITLKENGQLIGTCRLFGFDFDQKGCETSYMMHPDFQGRGYMSESIRGLVDYAVKELGFQRVQARCAVDNVASARVMQAVGMKFEQQYISQTEGREGIAYQIFALEKKC